MPPKPRLGFPDPYADLAAPPPKVETMRLNHVMMISLHGPNAAAFFANGKRKLVENRRGPCRVRGWVAIHATRPHKRDASHREALELAGVEVPGDLTGHHGRILGVAHLIDSHRGADRDDPLQTGPHVWEFDASFAFTPEHRIEYKGRQSWWPVTEPPIVERLRKLIERAELDARRAG